MQRGGYWGLLARAPNLFYSVLQKKIMYWKGATKIQNGPGPQIPLLGHAYRKEITEKQESATERSEPRRLRELSALISNTL